MAITDSVKRTMDIVVASVREQSERLLGKKRKPEREPDSVESCSKRIKKIGISCFTEIGVVQILLERDLISGFDLSRLSCVSRAFNMACQTEDNWQRACENHWPCLSCPRLQRFIQWNGGYCKFFRTLLSDEKSFQKVQGFVDRSRAVAWMKKLFFGMDITRAGEPVYSIQIDVLEFAVVPSLEGHCFRIEDKKLMMRLFRHKGRMNQALGDMCCDVAANCFAFCESDACFTTLLSSSSKRDFVGVGRHLCITLRDSFLLQGTFRSTKFYVELTLTISCSKAANVPGESTYDIILDSLGFEVRFSEVSRKVRPGAVPVEQKALEWKEIH